MWLLFLDFISRISFIFSLVITAVIILYNIGVSYYIFPSIVFVSFLSHIVRYLLKEKGKLLQAIPYMLLVFLPVGLDEKIIVMIIAFISLYLNITQKVTTYGLAVDHFKKTNLLALSIFVLTFIMRYLSTSRFRNLEYIVVPSLIIYFVVSIILLRVLRYMEYRLEDRRVISVNIGYAIALLLFSILLSIPIVRDNIFFITSNIFSFVYFIFLTTISVVFIIIGYGLGWIFYLIVRFLANTGLIGRVNARDFELNPALSRLLRLLWEREERYSKVIDNLLVLSFYIIVIGIVILILVWVLRRVQFIRKREENYIEEKEFLFPTISPRKILERIMKRENLGIIREYYRRYLLESKKLGIELRPSDTSYDVYRKTSFIFNSEIIKRIREIYIYVRYGLGEVTSEMSREFLELFRIMHRR